MRCRFMVALSSSAVEQVHYDAAHERLDIRYTGGDLYSYFGVPPETYRALLAADSAGAFVNREIKPNFRFELEARRRRFRPEE